MTSKNPDSTPQKPSKATEKAQITTNHASLATEKPQNSEKNTPPAPPSTPTPKSATSTDSALQSAPIEHTSSDSEATPKAENPRVKSNRKNVTYKKKQDIAPHPLQSPWTFWYCKKNKQPNFETTLVSLGTSNTVEEFFSLYSHLKRPHELYTNSNLHLFRGTTRPMWENFPNGGHWVLRLRKGCLLLSRMWEELLIACIGENFDEPDVLGVVITIRPKEDALYVWNANQQLKYTICEKLKSILHLPPSCPMEYRTNRYNMESRLVHKQDEHEILNGNAPAYIPASATGSSNTPSSAPGSDQIQTNSKELVVG